MKAAVDEMRRPRIKPEHRAYRTVDGNLRVGSVVYGIGAEVSLRHPSLRLPAADIARAMADLTEAGYVEDAGAPPPEELTAAERERYSRSMSLQRWMDLRPRSSPAPLRSRIDPATRARAPVGGCGDRE
ncbi:hypothetical protein [Streptomyces sp. FZ201]|uniref:hypothetical protein n=1 Tax=Streptomyces sp. FZ201 TaxID=3057122 RepID=UPI0021C1E8A5|nr:hypothetical protein [Streptomyces sp. FZ201]